MNKGKYAKYKVLMKEEGLQRYLPETAVFNPSNFWRLMGKYNDVILKPTGGQGGVGVIRVNRAGPKKYVIHTSSFHTTKVGKEQTLQYLKGIIKNKYYIVQQRIPLAKYRGRIFDIRVMAQRRLGKPWNITGKLVKVAGAGYIITNTARSRGYVTEIEKVASANVRNKLDQISLLATRTLSKAYKGLRTVGIDMAMDDKGGTWIIECNFSPASSLFRKLKDKTMYRRILSYYSR